MRIRIVTLIILALGSQMALAADPRSPVDWPPKAVPRQQEGKVPDFKEKNGVCLDCHADIMDVASARKNVINLHRRHLESKKIAYEGKNRDCLTCHETITPVDGKAPKKEGWFAKGDVYHPNWLQNPKGVWKKLIVHPDGDEAFARIDALKPSDPHLYKPSLKRLVCAECHGPDSKIKTFYGAPAGMAAN